MIYHPTESGGTLWGGAHKRATPDKADEEGTYLPPDGIGWHSGIDEVRKKAVGAPTFGRSPHRFRVSPCGLEDGYFTISLRTAVASAPVRRTK